MSNITRDGIEVLPGQEWRDLDWRARGRTKHVIRVTDGYAIMGAKMDSTKYLTRVAIRRMHKHSTGWQLVT